VAGREYEKSVSTWVKRRWKLSPEFIHADASQCGVTNAYEDPERLGADRWANLIAAHAHYRGPVVIIDCGTAITIDAMDASGTHLGGLIVPGMDLMSAALVGNAAGIELRELESESVSLLGSSTELAVAGGILYAVVALVDRVCQDLRAELGKATRVIVTGGDAGRVLPLLSQRARHDPDLVLKGLAVFAEGTAGCAT
jgi:type III pantothenate kinase